MSKFIPATAVLLAVSSIGHASVNAPYGQLPLSFEANQGQADASVDFVARGPGYALSLTPGAAVLGLHAPQATVGESVRLSFHDANTKAQAAGVDKAVGVSNYFIGSDPSHWHTGVPNFAKVRYSDIYPGIDVVYYGNQRQLEYDFVVAPGADPARIAIDFQGVRALEVNSSGDLILKANGHDLVQHKPVIYQTVAGRRRVIAGRYVVQGTRARFKVAPYDRSQPLIIDPTLGYSTYFGSKDFGYGDGIAVDASGNAYVTGLSYCAGFPSVWGTWSAPGNGDAFIAKLNRAGTQLLYASYFGGSGEDIGHGIAVDASGNAYLTGVTRSQDLPTTHGAVQSRLGAGAIQNAFVARFNAYGDLVYSTYLGGASSDVGQAIAVDSSRSAYVTGYTSSKDFPTTAHALQRSLTGLQNVFVTKLNANGSALEYSTLLGGDDYDFGFGIAVNKQGNAYVTGATYGIFTSKFPTTSNAYQTAYAGSGDAFVSKLSADGSSLVYSTLLGGSSYDGGRGIALDANGDAYVTGYTQSSAFPTTAGVVQSALSGTEDAFVAKLSSDGAALTYSTYLGGSGIDGAHGIAVGSNGYAYITGFTVSVDFPTTRGTIQTYNGSGREPFVAALNTTGSQLVYSTYLGGSNGDGAYAIAVDPASNAYVTGYTNSVDFPVTNGAARTELASGASEDAFIARIAPTN